MAGNGPASGSTFPAPDRANVYSRGPAGRKQIDRYGFGDIAQRAQVVDWAAIPSELIHDAISAVTRVGDAITFSRTSDGGAYSVTILSGGKQAKQWPSTDEQCAELLVQIVERAG